MAVAVPAWLNAVSGAPDYDATDLRLLDAFMMTTGDNDGVECAVGVRPGTGLMPSISSGNWQVAPGVATVSLSGKQGAYRVAVSALESGAIPAADSVNPRTDIIVLQVYDSGTAYAPAAVVYVAGTAGPSPSTPSTPDGAALLGTVTVPASGTGSATVVDSRSFAVASGGIQPVSDLPVNPYPGQPVWDLAAKGLRIHDGSKWQALPGNPDWTPFNISTAHWALRSGYDAPAWRVQPNGLVEWKGAINQTDAAGITTGSTKPFGTTIPAACTPSVTRSFPVVIGRTGDVEFVARLDVDSTGAMTIQFNGSGTVVVPWMAFDGVSYYL